MLETRIVLRKYLCLLFSGKAGVGKTTCAGMALNYMKSVYGLDSPEIFSVAYTVKTTAKNSFGWDGVKDEKGRDLLQAVGKAGRDYNKDIWIKGMVDHFYTNGLFLDFVVVDDWRFPNEYDYLINDPAFHVVKVRIESPEREILKGTKQAKDVSETSLPSFNTRSIKEAKLIKAPDFYDYVIINNSSLEDVDSIIKTIVDIEVSKLKYF